MVTTVRGVAHVTCPSTTGVMQAKRLALNFILRTKFSSLHFISQFQTFKRSISTLHSNTGQKNLEQHLGEIGCFVSEQIQHRIRNKYR